MTDDFSNFIEAVAISIVANGLAGIASSSIGSTSLLATTSKLGISSATAIGPGEIVNSLKQASDSMNNIVMQNFRNKAAAVTSVAIKTGQKTSESALSQYIQSAQAHAQSMQKTQYGQIADKVLDGSLEVFDPYLYTSKSGVYANGKLFVLQGGLSAFANWRVVARAD